MAKNLVLAIIPLGLSIALFSQPWRSRSLVWWLAAIAWLLFLPNAAYTLTDVIHLIARLREQPPLPLANILLIQIPVFAIYMLIGFQSHVLSLMGLGQYLRKSDLSTWVLPLEIITNLLVAIGIYLGRFQRLNSWYIFTRPEALFEKTLGDLYKQSFPILISVIFIIITVLYYLFKIINFRVIQCSKQKFTRL